ncbi:mitochondrial inner membrane protein OXA1-like [Pistacia vera]|uniref:mitochondrial inner membrane protein OXA1-like n=1 Tax=Pistacia vera TaxID=55513 RepID=UPI001262CCD3|nr:mitochondrial inner membrane protein OXA1-like [Pistacia vera]
MQKLFREYGVTPFTPMKGLFINAPIFMSFFFAISNMAEKVPSFKTGGAFWFTDLSSPDEFYIFPILCGLTFLITVECNTQDGMEGNPTAGIVKNVSRGFAALSVPLTMGFPQAIFCYWITSNLFSLVYGLVLKAPGVKKFLGVPQIPVAPPTTTPQPSFSLFSAIKQVAEAKAARQAAASSRTEQSKVTEERISSSAVLSQRIKNLEKQVKGRKKNKKR